MSVLESMREALKLPEISQSTLAVPGLPSREEYNRSLETMGEEEVRQRFASLFRRKLTRCGFQSTDKAFDFDSDPKLFAFACEVIGDREKIEDAQYVAERYALNFLPHLHEWQRQGVLMLLREEIQETFKAHTFLTNHSETQIDLALRPPGERTRLAQDYMRDVTHGRVDLAEAGRDFELGITPTAQRQPGEFNKLMQRIDSLDKADIAGSLGMAALHKMEACRRGHLELSIVDCAVLKLQLDSRKPEDSKPLQRYASFLEKRGGEYTGQAAALRKLAYTLQQSSSQLGYFVDAEIQRAQVKRKIG